MSWAEQVRPWGPAAHPQARHVPGRRVWGWRRSSVRGRETLGTTRVPEAAVDSGLAAAGAGGGSGQLGGGGSRAAAGFCTRGKQERRRAVPAGGRCGLALASLLGAVRRTGPWGR